uniref:GPN-loop GTPase n=1 Tax=Candidozyma auris TaxID=498019 RepID=A0A0L0NS83_CANAR
MLSSEKKPATIICIGMAGSGKTTFMQRLNAHLHQKKNPPYILNLDPAVLRVPYHPNIDIRDSVNYKKVQQEYGLGPNGAIVTSLNLFSTKVDQVIKLIDSKGDKYKNVIVDTPGQIECFVWSASGAIITEAFASTFPTVIAYIVDTPRNTSPTTFMSNMLYACSILYKTKLPMIVVFNKTDVKKADFAIEWMQDFEAFQMAMMKDKELNGDDGSSSGYMSSLVNSMSLMLEEFYSQLDVLACSAYTGQGFDDFMDAVDRKIEEYHEFYEAERDRILKEKAEREEKRKTDSLSKLMKDMDLKKGDEKDSHVLSDYEDEDDNNGEVDRDSEEETERQYTFPEDRNAEVSEKTDADLQARYQAAFEDTAKDASSKTAESIANYIRQ